LTSSSKAAQCTYTSTSVSYFRNKTSYPLTIQLCQVGVLYHGLVKPGEVFFRETGAVHFTIRARINDSFRDDTDVLLEGAVPAIGAVALTAGPIGGLAMAAGIAGPATAATATYAGTVLGTAMLIMPHLKYTSMSSAGWYSGYRHELEICGGGQHPFKIRDKNTDRVVIIE
jgi:hypothetical protein